MCFLNLKYTIGKEVHMNNKGKIILAEEADKLREKENTSIDEIFRRMFKC